MTRKPGVLQSTGSQGARHDLATEQRQHYQPMCQGVWFLVARKLNFLFCSPDPGSLLPEEDDASEEEDEDNDDDDVASE